MTNRLHPSKQRSGEIAKVGHNRGAYMIYRIADKRVSYGL